MSYYPLIIISGQAGSGKDSLAQALLRNIPAAAAIALADPMKELAAMLFGFVQEQLYGPSASRNAVDPRWTQTTTLEALNPYPFHGYREAVESWLKRVVGEEREGDLLELERWYSDLLLEQVPAHGNALTPRLVLQTLGTEFGRKLKPTLWADYAIRRARTLLEGDKNFVVISDGRFRNELLQVKACNGTCIRIERPQDKASATATTAAGISGHASETEQKDIPNHFFDWIIQNDGSLDNLEEKATDIAVNLRERYWIS